MIIKHTHLSLIHISSIRKLGIRQVIISTEKNDVVERRAEKLELEVIHGVSNKKRTVEAVSYTHLDVYKRQI